MTVPIVKTPFLITSKQFSTDPRILQYQLLKSYTEIAIAVNYRTIGIFDKFETITGNQYFNDDDPKKRRQSYRRVYTTSSIINPVTSIPHEINIQDTFQLLQLYATAQNSSLSNFIPIPYINITTLADSIGLDMDSTNINIYTSTANWTSFSAVVVLEYYL